MAGTETTNGNVGSEPIIRESRFTYSSENPPPLEELESKVFAVHATDIFPVNGVMKAGAVFHGPELQGEPPSFRPTLHWSLGEVSQPHHNYRWDSKHYAVVTPIKELEPSLVNVSPSDTFTLGDYELTDKSIVVVPKGTDVPALPNNIAVVEYEAEVGLRKAIAKVIQEKGGWDIRMKPGGIYFDSVAEIDGTEINSSQFFKSLLHRLPDVSYGTNSRSELGEAYRFGVIDNVMQQLILLPLSGKIFSTSEVRFYRALIDYNLSKLEVSLQRRYHAQTLSPQAMEAFERKKDNLSTWLNVVDVDLELRKQGVTFITRSEPFTQIVNNRGDKESIYGIVNDRPDDLLHPAIGSESVSPSEIADVLYNMPFTELQDFLEHLPKGRFLHSHTPEILLHTDVRAFYAEYALRRWLLVGNEQATQERLPEVLRDNLRHMRHSTRKADIEEILRDYLYTNSNRKAVAGNIMKYLGLS